MSMLMSPEDEGARIYLQVHMALDRDQTKLTEHVLYTHKHSFQFGKDSRNNAGSFIHTRKRRTIDATPFSSSEADAPWYAFYHLIFVTYLQALSEDAPRSWGIHRWQQRSSA